MHNLFENSLDPFLILDKRGLIFDVNTSAEKITGISRNKLIGSILSNYFTEPEKFEEILKRVTSGGMAHNIPLSVRLAGTGLNSEVLVNVTLYEDSKAKEQSFFVAMRDITEREKVDYQFRLLVQNAPIDILIIDREFKMTFINRVAPGFDIDKIIGLSVFAFIAPEYHEMVRAIYQKVLDTGKSELYELAGQTNADGTIGWYRTSVGPLMKNGKLNHLF